MLGKTINGRLSKLSYNLHWAKTYLKKAGALDNVSQGVWAITSKGKAVGRADIKPAVAAIRRDRRQSRKARPSDLKPDDDSSQNDWKDELLTLLKAMSPEAFERLSKRVLREAGFIKVEVTGQSGDGGIDGIGVLRIALLSFQVYFQCKRWKGSVPARQMRDFRGAMVGRQDKGLFITTGTFTADAQKEASRDGAPAIDLIDGDRLCDLLKDYKLGVRTEMVEDVTLQPDWFANF